MGTLLIGYDVERIEGKVPGDKWVGVSIPKDVTDKFLQKMEAMHTQLNIPCTLFLVGKVLERNVEDFQRIADKDIFDFQQHTYSHIALKTVVEESKDNIFIKGESLKIIYKEISRTNKLLMDYLGVKCIGLCGPYGYYRGLSDRPDILKILYKLGIRFTRTYLRNEKDYQPVSWDVQPYWYKRQDYSNILEIPVCGWHDCQWRKLHGWGNTDAYLTHLRSQIDKIVEHDLVWSYVQHDWSSIIGDSNMSITRKFIEYAQSKRVKFLTHKDYYLQEKQRRNEEECQK